MTTPRTRLDVLRSLVNAARSDNSRAEMLPRVTIEAMLALVEAAVAWRTEFYDSADRELIDEALRTQASKWTQPS